MSFDPFVYAAKEIREDDDREWYYLERSIVYPATVARIGEVITKPEMASELVDHKSANPYGPAMSLEGEARAMGVGNLELALLPKSNCPPDAAATRVKALDLVRRWYTQALHVACGGDGTGIGLHWANEPEFKD